MEKGAVALVRIILGAFALGLLIVVFHPDYRGTVKALWRGEVEQSPIWESNRDYYREVGYRSEAHDHAE